MTSSLLRLEEGEGRPASSTFSCRLSCCRSLFASSCSSAAGLVDLYCREWAGPHGQRSAVAPLCRLRVAPGRACGASFVSTHGTRWCHHRHWFTGARRRGKEQKG